MEFLGMRKTQCIGRLGAISIPQHVTVAFTPGDIADFRQDVLDALFILLAVDIEEVQRAEIVAEVS